MVALSPAQSSTDLNLTGLPLRDLRG